MASLDLDHYFAHMRNLMAFINKSLRRKVLVAVVGGVFLFFALTGIICTKSIRSLLLKEKYNTIKAISGKSISQLSSSLSRTESLLNTERTSLERIHQYPRSARRTIVIDKLKDLLENNSELLSIWADWEKEAVDSLDSKMLNTPGATASGKFCATLYRKDNLIEAANYNSDDDEEGEYYTIPKSTRQIYVSAPYFENYEGEKNYLIITMSLPIIVKNEVIGVVGADLNISQINQQIIEQLKEEDGRFFIVGSDQKLNIYDNEEEIGQEASKVLLKDNDNKELVDAIQSKTSGFYDFIDKNGKEYIAYLTPTTILQKGEVSILLIPGNFVTTANLKIFIITLTLLLTIGLLIFYLLIAYILRKIIEPVNKVNNALKELGEGNYAQVTKVDIKTGDELEAMATSFNNLYTSIEEVVGFTKAIGTGNLSATLKSKGEGDILGNSLIVMRDNLVRSEEEERQRKLVDERQSWTEKGLSLFAQELRQDYEDTNTLYSNVIKLIVNYIEANQGALYLVKEDDDKKKCFEMVGCIAWSRIKMQKKTFLLEEGLLGACYFEKAPIELTEIPEDYIEISSGLGGSRPRMLMLTPLIHNEEVVGMIEVASFKLFDTYTKTYLKRISESFASSITSIKINARTNELLAISKIQAEEMQAQEEEMRQNIEELHATQEEMRRKASYAERYQNAIHQNFITLVVDSNMVVLDLNDKAKAVLGHDTTSIIGKPLTEHVHEDDWQTLHSDFSVAQNNGVVSSKLTLIGHNKQLKRIQTTLIPDNEQNGNIAFIAYTLN